jgi:hypothetical protein
LSDGGFLISVHFNRWDSELAATVTGILDSSGGQDITSTSAFEARERSLIQRSKHDFRGVREFGLLHILDQA